MNDLFQAALEVQGFLLDRRVGFCIIGGVAVSRWGEVRTTKDVDFTIYTGLENEDELIGTLLAAFSPRRDNAADFAIRNRVVLLKSAAGIPIDISLGRFPFESEMMDRATFWEYEPGVNLKTCSAEDLIVMKVFAGRPIDALDVEGIIIRQGKRLDWEYIGKQLPPLLELKGNLEAWPQLLAIRQREE